MVYKKAIHPSVKIKWGRTFIARRIERSNIHICIVYPSNMQSNNKEHGLKKLRKEGKAQSFKVTVCVSSQKVLGHGLWYWSNHWMCAELIKVGKNHIIS